MHILVTGGAGYIGSHTCVELLNRGHQVTVLDNLCNSSEESLNRVRQITGQDLTFYQADLLDRDAVNQIFDRESVDAVIHFAGLKAVGESVSKPLEYYHNNLGTGRGYSVLEMIQAFSKVCKKPIPYTIKPRRPGDIAVCYADPSLAQKELGWTAKRGLMEMCEDSWRWQTKNPNGYRL